MLFDTVTIVGVGLIGGSLGLALKAKNAARRIIGVGHRESSMKRALERGAVDETSLNIEEAVGDSDWVILAASVRLIPDHAALAAGGMKPGAILSDVGSTKEGICAELARHGHNGLPVVGMHPLAGSEQRGIEAARASLFESTTCILTPGEGSTDEAVSKVTRAWEAIGATIVVLTPEDHDRLLAGASHLPHVIAGVLLNSLTEDCLSYGGTGLRDTTRIASGNPDLWRDICAANRRHILDAIERFQNEVEVFRQALAAEDDERVRDLLNAAKQRRDNLPAARLRNRE
ncbi:MAG: prephenate dehydrogenase [Planctomycetes bacterium]|nr:prephenate dehydrogenase [Planctomycetota bacterium]